MKILIVEDNREEAALLKEMLMEVLDERRFNISVVHSYEAADAFLRDHPVDLLFLDILVLNQSSFSLLRKPYAETFETIIVSGFPERAIQAFDHNALDFISKPVRLNRLGTALERFQNTRCNKKGFGKISIPTNERMILAEPEEILYVQAHRGACLVHFQGNSVRCKYKLAEIEDRLPESFLRIHKSYIINHKYLTSLDIRRGGKYTFNLDNIALPGGRVYYQDIKSKLQI